MPKKKHERMRPSHSPRRYGPFCSSVPKCSSVCMLPSSGMPTADDFELATVQLPEPADGQDLVRNLRHERGPLHTRVAACAGGCMRGWLHARVAAYVGECATCSPMRPRGNSALARDPTGARADAQALHPQRPAGLEQHLRPDWVIGSISVSSLVPTSEARETGGHA